MGTSIDLEVILTPISGDNPAGESLEYSPIYDEIEEARRADDILGLEGSWEGEPKRADWPKVLELTTEVLSSQSKDMQVAVWLLEALVQVNGYAGYAAGCKVLSGLMEQFWDTLYPEIEDDDLEFRAGPLEYLNRKIPFLLSQVAVTDPAVSPGYSMLDWQESQRVVVASSGEKEALLAAGKVTPEDFELAVVKSPLSFYETLQGDLQLCFEEFERLDDVVDQKFGNEAPGFTDLRKSLEESKRQVDRFIRDKGGSLENTEEDDETETVEAEPVSEKKQESNATIASGKSGREYPEPNQVIRFLGQGGREDLLWKEALERLKSSGIKAALEMLLGAACSSQSIRDKTNCQILMAKLCLKEGKAELAKPIVDEIEQLISGLQLEKWESPVWIAEVYDVLYQCMLAAPDRDEYKTRELLTKLCQIDVTKALQYS